MRPDARGPAGRHLLPLLGDIRHVLRMSLADWDETLRLARQARLLGVIAHRIEREPELLAAVPPAVHGHLTSSINFAAHRLQMVRIELADLEAALPAEIDVVLLKGAAYIAQELEFSRGRMPNDVDLLVARRDLDKAESALAAAGWEAETTDAYDQRYYREWSHELPPMRASGHALEVDLHHTIAPVTSRTRADDELLEQGRTALPGSRYCVLAPADQVIHAVIHLFQDSEMSGRLRDLVDIDGLIRLHMRSDDDWRQLRTRAERHRASGLLWFALHYCHQWLGTPWPAVAGRSEPPRPAARYLMDLLMRHACLPRLADGGEPRIRALARGLGQLRYHWLRMPPALLARHLCHKGLARLSLRSSG
ncbi:MAG: nucleotidyltransferase family protein [Rhodocyclaceae bacterium]|nr:nucleotidyltransferase family protein [Rhodocyclaceae bacterium]